MLTSLGVTRATLTPGTDHPVSREAIHRVEDGARAVESGACGPGVDDLGHDVVRPAVGEVGRQWRERQHGRPFLADFDVAVILTRSFTDAVGRFEAVVSASSSLFTRWSSSSCAWRCSMSTS